MVHPPSPMALLMIGVIALLMFGPKRLPDLARSLGEAMREFKKASNEAMEEIHRSAEAEKPKEAAEPTTKTL